MLTSITIMDIVNKIIDPLQAATALEIGTGEGGMLARVNIPSKVGVDNYEPSLFAGMGNHPGIIVMKYDIQKLRDIFLAKSFDVVFGFDILEHFDSATVPKLIEMCELLAKKMVVFWMPIEKTPAANPLPENPGQEHKSLLRISDFDARGYEMIRFPHYWRIPREDPTVDGLLCFKRMA